MRRLFLFLVAVAAIVALVSLPAAAADFKFGGQAWTRYYSFNNMKDGTNDLDDNLNGFYTRFRLYFTATGSENLKAVFKYEIDDIWGNGRLGTTSTDGGSLDRSDNSTQTAANSGGEVKNAYIDFNIPNTPLNAMVGVLPAKLGRGLAFDDDTNGIVVTGKFHPVKVSLVYSRLQDNSQPTNESLYGTGSIQAAFSAANTPETPFTSHDDWDLWAAAIRFDPTQALSLDLAGTWINTTFDNPSRDFNLYNLVLDADYKADLFTLYFTGGKNFGAVDLTGGGSADFKGWMITTGGTVRVDPVVIGLDFYYGSGQPSGSDDIKTYVTPGLDGRNTYNMDEVVFLGWFDDESATYKSFHTTASQGVNINNVSSTGLTRSNQTKVLTNLWAIGAHVDFKPFEKTLLQVGGAYMQFVEDVPSRTSNQLPTGTVEEEDNKLGTSLYIRLAQGIVDGLELRAAFGYLFADDGFSPVKNEDDAYKFATGLSWYW